MEVDGEEVCTDCSDSGEDTASADVGDADRDDSGEEAAAGAPESMPERNRRDVVGSTDRANEEVDEDSDNGAEFRSASDSGAGIGSHIIDLTWDTSVDFEQFEEIAAETITRPESGDETYSDPLDAKIDSWKEQLLDLTRRSNLVDFSVTKTKTLPFYRADPTRIAETFVADEPLYIRRSEAEEKGGRPPDPETLEPNEVASIRNRSETENSLYQIGLREKRFQRERGVDSLFLALGTLRWYDVEHSDSELRTPLFLVRVELSEETNRTAHRHDYEITSEDAELLVNPALRKMLSSERGIGLPPDEAFDLDELEMSFAYLDELTSGFDRWRIAPEVILGIFDFSKFGIYTDLEENREAVKNNPFVKAINGDPSALPDPPETPTAEQLDETVSPADTYQVLDADSSQQEAIEAAKRGMSFVLQGPPGTGKSQTISNIIAEKMAADETVLFVSEKQAALDVVRNRLDDVGLGRFCLEAHGEKASKKAILEDLGRELRSDPLRHPANRDKIVGDLEEARTKLNQYKERLFYQPPTQSMTPYEAFGIVSKRDAMLRIDASVGDPTAYDQETIEDIEAELSTLTSYETEFDRNNDHVWRHTTLDGWRVDTRKMVRDALSTAITTTESLRAARERAEDFLDRELKGLAELREAARLFRILTSAPDVDLQACHFDPEFYARRERLQRLADLSTELSEKRSTLTETYDESIFSADGTALHENLSSYGFLRYVSPSYRRLKNRMLSHAGAEYSPGIDDLREDAKTLMRVQAIEEELTDHQGLIDQLGVLYDGSRTDWDSVLEAQEWVSELDTNDLVETRTVNPKQLTQKTIDDAAAIATQLEAAIDEWDKTAAADLENFLDCDSIRADGEPIERAELDALETWLEQRLDAVDQLQEWIQYREKRDEILDGPAGEFLAAYLQGNHPANQLVDTFKLNFYTQWINSIYSETNLDSFSATEFDELVDTFRRLDEQQREYAKAEIQHRVTNRRPQMELEHASSSEQVILRREVQKSRRHKPLRQLFDEISSLITVLKPCFMMSPLSVAQYLQCDSIEFDTVIFDEASQVMPQDAISSLIRGKQVIIAGDSKQLPPTSFFDADIETAEDVQEDLESILDEAATVLPEKRLRWHYRSRTNELIEFSNTKYYDGSLRTFPDNSPEERMGVDFVYVEDGLYDRGGSSTNEPEAEHVLKLIGEHIEERPNKGLGVVAFSKAQAQAIRDLVEERRDSDPELDAFVSEDDSLEGFFVKSLENVQGDERDALIFSVGYGPDGSGKISMNFGPLNQTGGERRLNVAVTRAKEHIQVVSSLSPGDIDLQRTNSRGVEDFKHYLEYAKHGEQALARSDSEPQTLQFDSEFEEAVYTALEDRGFDVVTQVQSSGYSIDLAIRHPDQPGKYVLGIECDGAAYHSSKTARDRDRTRQTVLESLGWTIHRIWSPDWASNKERELGEISSKVDDLLDQRATTDGGASTAEPEIEEVKVAAIPEAERGGIHSYLVDLEEISVRQKGDKSFDDVWESQIEGVLASVAKRHGPVAKEQAFKATINRWQISRLGKNIQQSLDTITNKMQTRGKVKVQDGFIWAGERPDSVPIRVNTDQASRSINEIPHEELAKAAHLLLDAGTRMTREDLVLEVARLIGYQRRGQNITDRIDAAIDVLLEEGCASTDIGADGSTEMIEFVDADIDRVLLNRVYA